MSRKLLLSLLVLLLASIPALADDAPTVLDNCQSLQASQQFWQFTNITPELSTEHAAAGNHTLKLNFGPDGAMGKSFKTNPQDWSHYKALSFDVFNPQDRPITLVVRIDDGDHPYKDRFERADALFLPPNKPTHVEIDLTNLLANDGPLVDVSNITQLILHAGHDEKVLYVDAFELIPLPQKDWPAPPVEPAKDPLIIDDAKDARKLADLWKNSTAKIQISTENAEDGFGSLKLILPAKGGNLRLNLTDKPMDWRPYRSLQFTLFNADPKPMKATVYIDDANTISSDNRFTVDEIPLPPGQSKEIKIDITRMVSRCGLKMDMSKITALKIDLARQGLTDKDGNDLPDTDAGDITAFTSGLRLDPVEAGVRNELRPGRIPGQTPATLARALLDDPEIKPLLPIFKTMGKKRFAICSHSASMSTHWSTSGAFFDIACEVVKTQDPDFEYPGPALYHYGGMTAGLAVGLFLQKMEDYKPTDFYLLVVPDPMSAEKQLVEGMKSAGARVFVFDAIKPWGYNPAESQRLEKLCADENATFLPLTIRGWGQPGSYNWCSVDGIHMETPGHIFYAKELLKEWARIYAPAAPAIPATAP